MKIEFKDGKKKTTISVKTAAGFRKLAFIASGELYKEEMLSDMDYETIKVKVDGNKVSMKELYDIAASKYSKLKNSEIDNKKKKTKKKVKKTVNVSKSGKKKDKDKFKDKKKKSKKNKDKKNKKKIDKSSVSNNKETYNGRLMIHSRN